MKGLYAAIILLFLLLSCDAPYYAPKDKVKDLLPVNTNFELIADSMQVAYEPGIESWFQLYKGDHIAIAEFSEPIVATSEVTWIKVANSQDKQGWITDGELMWNFIPSDSISQFIYFFSNSNLIFLTAAIVFVLVILLAWLGKKKYIPFILFNNIDSVYPLFLCLLVSASAVLYQSVQLFTPLDWLHYYFVPSLSPMGQPTLLASFLLSLWFIFIAILAVVDIVFKQLSSGSALVYLSGLVCVCVFCYLFFLFTTPFYVGYVLYAAFVFYFLYRVFKEIRFRYRCGNCGQKMKKRGECPRCGVMNK